MPAKTVEKIQINHSDNGMSDGSRLPTGGIPINDSDGRSNNTK